MRARGTVVRMSRREVLCTECEGERYCGWSVRARGTVEGV